MNEKPLIEALIKEGLIDESMLDEGGVLSGSTGELRRARAEAYILTRGDIDETELLAKLVDVFRLESASVEEYAHIERDVLELLPTRLVRQYHVIPAQVKDGKLIAYVTEPLADDARAELEDEAGHEIQELIWPAVRYYEALTRLLGDEPAKWLRSFLEGADGSVGLHEESLAELKPQVDWGKDWSPSSVSQFTRNTYDRDIVLKVLLGFSQEWLDSSAILVVGNGTIQAVFVRDWPLFESKDPEELKRTRGSIDPDAAAISSKPGRGTPGELGLVALFDAFGDVLDEELVTVPIPIGSRTAMVLLGRPRDTEGYDSTQLEATAFEVGDQLESIIKLVKSGGLPPAGERIPALPEEARDLSKEEDSESELVGEVADAFQSVASEVGVEELDESEIEIVSDASSESFVEMSGPGAAVDSNAEDDLSEDEPVDPAHMAPGMPYGGEPDLDNPTGGTIEFRRPKFVSGQAGRHTQNLEFEDNGGPRMSEAASSAFEEDSDPDEAEAPRMPGMASSAAVEDESEDESDGRPPTISAPAAANATMFGLPLTEKKKEPEEVQEAESNRTMFGLPLTAKKKAVADDEPEPEPQQKAELKPESEADEDSEVRVVTPQDVGDDRSEGSKTLMGGMQAAADIVGNMKVRSEDRAPQIGAGEAKRSDSAQPGGTVRGGIEAVNLEDSGAAEVETPETSDVSAPEEEASAVEAEDKPSKNPGFIPGMMILKGAGRSTVSDGDDASVSGPDEKPARKRRPTPNPNTTLPDYGEALQEEHSERKPASKPGESDSIPVLDSSPPLGIADDDSTSTQMGMQDDWTAANQSEEYKKKNEKVHDAWFDYFAPESSGAKASESSIARDSTAKESNGGGKKHTQTDDLPDFFADDEDEDEPQSHPSMSSESSEPRTIPPDMLERLLESGPNALDLQESLMKLEDRDPSVAFAAADKVAESGALALEPLSEVFPGRIFIDRYQHTAETLPPVGEHGPVLAALVRIGGDEAALVASKHIRSTSNERRFYATYLLTEVPAELALTDLTERAFDKDRQIRNVAARVLRGYARSPHFKVRVLKPLRAAMEGDDEIRLEAAANMLATFRDIQSIPALIQALGQHPEHTNRVIYNALQTITLKEWSSPYEWKNWWESASSEPRSKWLLEAMDSSSLNLRKVAFDEIQRIPGLESSYHYDQPQKLRRRAKEELAAWLEENEPA